MQVKYKRRTYEVDYDQDMEMPFGARFTLYINGEVAMGCLSGKEMDAILNNPAEIARIEKQIAEDEDEAKKGGKGGINRVIK